MTWDSTFILYLNDLIFQSSCFPCCCKLIFYLRKANPTTKIQNLSTITTSPHHHRSNRPIEGTFSNLDTITSQTSHSYAIGARSSGLSGPLSQRALFHHSNIRPKALSKIIAQLVTKSKIRHVSARGERRRERHRNIYFLPTEG